MTSRILALLVLLLSASLSYGEPIIFSSDANFANGWGADTPAQDYNYSFLLDENSSALEPIWTEDNAAQGSGAIVVPNSIEQLMEFNHDSLLMGGNITGGGEVIMAYPAPFGSASGDAAGQCTSPGYMLTDLVDEPLIYAEEFHPEGRVTPLKSEFSDEELLFGAPVDLKKDATHTLQFLEQRLSLWESHSPLIVGLVRKKITSLKWRVTNLPLRNPLTDNGAVVELLQKSLQQLQACNQAGHAPALHGTIIPHETIASFWPRRGVLISNTAWTHAGLHSRAGTLVHEALRSFQYEDLFPLSHGQVRRLVRALLIANPQDFEERLLDKMLLSHSNPTLGVAYFLDNTRLKMACGQIPEGHSWLQYEDGDLKKFDEALLKLVHQLPEKLSENTAVTADETMSLGLRLRTAVIFSRLVHLFGDEPIKRLIRDGHAPAWFQFIDPSVLTKASYSQAITDYKELRERVCQDTEYRIPWGPILSPSIEQLDLLSLHDTLLGVLKLNLWSDNEASDSTPRIHPNIYLPAKDVSVTRFHQLLAEHNQNPQAMTQFSIMIRRVGGIERFKRLNQRFAEEYQKLNIPPDAFLKMAYPLSDI